MVVISTDGGRAIVGRLDTTGHILSFVPALNWEELEEDAIDAVMLAGGGPARDELWACPGDLAARAVWPAEGV